MVTASSVRRRTRNPSVAPVRRGLFVLAVLWGLAASAVAFGQLSTNAFLLKETPNPPFGPPGADGNFGRTQVAGDFNGDGFSDLAVAQRLNTGSVYVLHGSQGGPVFAETLSQLFTGGFGTGMAVCDFNEDGVDDLAVGAPTTSISTNSSAGVVLVYLGGEGGSGFFGAPQAITQDDLGLSSDSDDRFGETIASGDFDGDGHCDLAIASPDEDITPPMATTVADAGQVNIVYGLGTGFFSTNDSLRFDELSIPEPVNTSVSVEAFDNFGETLLAVPKAGGDGLLIGIPSKNTAGLNTGRVWNVVFSGRSLVASRYTDYEDQGDLAASSGGERMGGSLALMVFNGIGLDPNAGEPFVVIGVPNYVVSGQRSGAVVLNLVANIGISSNPGIRLDEEFFSFTPHHNENFGEALVVADFNNDGTQDLAIGVPGKVPEVRALGIQEFGAVRIVFSGPSGFVSFQGFDEEDVGGVYERDDFGRSLAVGDFFGTGAASLAVGVPRKNEATVRGSSPNESHGVVYVLPGVETSMQIPILTRTGVPLAGSGDPRLVTELSDASAAANGTPAWRGRFDDMESFVAVNGIVVFEDSDIAPPDTPFGENVDRGFAFAGSGLYGHIDWFSTNRGTTPPGVFFSVITPTARYVELDVFNSFTLGAPSQLVSTTENRLYFLSRTFSGFERVVRTAVNFTGSLESLVAVDDPVDGLVVKDISRFDVSRDGSHLAFYGILGLVADNGFLVIDGVRVVATNSSFFGDASIGSFTALAVNNQGDFAFAANLTDFSESIYYGSAGVVTARVSAAVVDGVTLTSYDLVNLSLANDGSLLHLWSDPGFSLGRGADGSRQDVLFATCLGPTGSKKILATGDAVASTLPAEAPATVTGIYGVNSNEGLKAKDDGNVFVRVGLERGYDVFDAIVELRYNTCHIFSDGFESGTTSAW